MVEHESQDQSASVGKFSFTEEGKLHNIHFTEKAFFFLFMILSPFEGNSVTDCDLLQLHLPTRATFPCITIKLKCSFFNCTLCEDEPQILHFTWHNQIEYTGYILSLSQVLLQLSNANMQARAHVHMQIWAPPSTLCLFLSGISACFPKIDDEDQMLQCHWKLGQRKVWLRNSYLRVCCASWY